MTNISPNGWTASKSPRNAGDKGILGFHPKGGHIKELTPGLQE